MSGGSWNYACNHLHDLADSLMSDDDPLRRALGKRMQLMAKAMHDIEWVDSNDATKGSELPAIKAALEFDGASAVLDEICDEAERGLRAIAAIRKNAALKSQSS